MIPNHSEKAVDSTLKGHIFIVSAPSGTGKTTLCKVLLKTYPEMVYSISYTTRKPRANEQEGIDYHFISKEAFRLKINEKKWAEWAEVHGNYYGTSLECINETLAKGHDILLDIDVQGMLQIVKQVPESVTIFIKPPTLEVLKKRLLSRGTDNNKVIERRLVNAKKELLQTEHYNHIIVNDNLKLAIEELIALIKHYKKRG